MIHLGFWDWALLTLVSGQATLLATLRHPKGKALIMTLPIPFTLASLAVGTPVNTTHVAALNVLLGFAHAVRLLHNRVRMPIIPAIALSVAGYCVSGALLKTVLPQSNLSFWVACGLTLLAAIAVHILFPRRDEPEHHSPLPPWAKFPMVAAVVAFLIAIKRLLQGFTALFPMVGVFAAYESRFSLAAFCRAITDFVLAMIPMMAVVRLVQPRLGLGLALAIGWAVFIPVLVLMEREF
ncbi:MAG: hypothetical protein MUP19_10660 [Candidatus Aminicenantes bacterium]|nr:hypothetical protein [Candidatus Aminicenantes bacterium]